jgi:hypothetical protein
VSSVSCEISAMGTFKMPGQINHEVLFHKLHGEQITKSQITKSQITKSQITKSQITK